MIDGLKDEHRTALIGVLSANEGVERVVLFGSRATQTHSATSDIDIALFGNNLTRTDLACLAETVDELPYPYSVDLLVYEQTRNEKLRSEINVHGVEWFNRSLECWNDTVYGRISADFAERVLRVLCEPENGVQTGPFGSQLHKRDYVDIGTPIITVEHLGENRIIHENLPRVTDADKKRLSKYILREGDIVFSRVGSVDRRSLVRAEEDGWLFSGRCLRVRPDPSQIDPVFLSYFLGLRAFKEHIRSIAVGATMPSINTKILSNVTVYAPPLPEQRRIAHILGTLDEKIELNRRMNETLEEMARAIFKDWFVDFGPVRAKMEGRDPYLPEDVWQLFPDRLVESELGEVPEGWGVKALDEVANYRNGLALQKFRPEPDEGQLPVVKIAQLRSGVADSGEWAKASINPECVINDGDIIFSWSGSLLVKIWAGGRAALNQHLFKVTSSDFPKWFYLYFTKHHLAEFQSIAADKTTTMGHIKRQHLKEAKCAVPSSEILEAASDRLESLLQQSILNDVASRRLTALRDSLLPGLVSGDIGLG